MKILLYSLAVLGLAAVGCSDSAQDKPKVAEKSDKADSKPQVDPVKLKQEELAKLQGTWIVVSTTALGKTLTEKDLGDGPPIKMVIDGDKYTDRFTGTFTIDPTQSPKWFDRFPPADATLGSRQQFGIYEFDGDHLKICTAVPSLPERPKTFDPADNPGHLLFVYKKAKEE
jgi:uncharacterized protein (TIGR03067 family)